MTRGVPGCTMARVDGAFADLLGLSARPPQGKAFGLGGRDLAARKLDDWYEVKANSTERLK